jgi:hypothetical protein
MFVIGGDGAAQARRRPRAPFGVESRHRPERQFRPEAQSISEPKAHVVV